MPYCKKCGTELPEGAKYCPVCGTSTSTEETAAVSTVQVDATVSDVSGVKLAFWGDRFVAWLIDVLILGVVVGILAFHLVCKYYMVVWLA